MNVPSRIAQSLSSTYAVTLGRPIAPSYTPMCRGCVSATALLPSSVEQMGTSLASASRTTSSRSPKRCISTPATRIGLRAASIIAFAAARAPARAAGSLFSSIRRGSCG